MSLDVGELVEGKYRIIGLIGEGGMGAVYLGENVRIQRKIAIKVLHGSYATNSEMVARFEREAQAAGRIGNDHILEVLDLGSLSNGDHFMVMEYLDGETLSARIKRFGRLTPQQTLPLAQQMLAGLAAAHGAGIVHRDLKPENVFILKEKAGKRDYVKIIDFGISKFQPLSGDGMKMTRTGAVMGTPYYMSPEQASGSRDADARSDVYAVAVMLYEAVTGHVPFDAPTFNQLMFKIVLSEPPPPQSIVPDLDPAFASIIAKGMARDVTQRFQSASEFIAALEAWSERGAAVTVPPPGNVDGIVAGVTGRSSVVSSPALGGSAALGSSAPFGVSAAIPPGASTLGSIPGRGTPGNWATSQADVVIPKKSAAPLIAALALGGLLVIGGGAAAAFALLRNKPPEVGVEAAAVAPPAEPVAAEKPAEPPAVVPVPALPPEPAAPPASASAAKKGVEPPASRTAARTSAQKRADAKTATDTKSATKPNEGAKPAPAKPANPDFGY